MMLSLPNAERLLGRWIAQAKLGSMIAHPTARCSDCETGGLRFSGFLEEALGIGRSGQLNYQALSDAGFPVETVDLRHWWRGTLENPKELRDQTSGVWFLNCNAPEAIASLAKARLKNWKTVYRIGYWAYELPSAPAYWIAASRYFHEIWTPSHFTAHALRGSTAKVRIMPHAVAIPTGNLPRPPEYSGTKQNVLVVADVRSSLTRKNVLGAIDIYEAAVSDGLADTQLVIKLVGTEAESPTLREVVARAGKRKDIVLVTRDMSYQEAAGFTGHASLLLHPHRAEGYGLMLAEACALGTPVLATAWSGNMDYMEEARSLLIPARQVPVQDPDKIYAMTNQYWAEPDSRVAAQMLRSTLQCPENTQADIEMVRTKLDQDRKCWSAEALYGMPFSEFVSKNGNYGSA